MGEGGREEVIVTYESMLVVNYRGDPPSCAPDLQWD